ncbi:MAG: GNAT family N-acetyltransferase [Actinomycetota bacterium]
MSLEIRSCRPDEFRLFLETCEAAFGYDIKDDDVERFKRVISTDRTFAAFDDETMIGTAGSFPFTMTIPGGEVPAGGVTMVGVLPSHRRRGVLTQLMQAQLLDARARGEPIAVLWASEGSIYQRFGYGLATKQCALDMERDRATFLDPSAPIGRCRLLAQDEALKSFPEIYERVRVSTPGMFARTPDWWEALTLADPEADRRGGGPMFRALWEIDGRAEAYALYRAHHEWSEGLPAGWLEVLEAVATTPVATREIWRFLLGVDLMARIKAWFVAADHPLFLMLTEPRRLRFTAKDALWLRVVDLASALALRSYASDGSLTFEITDDTCPWNEGTWELHAAPEGAQVGRSDASPELRLSAADLGAVYLGGLTFGELARAGRVQELVGGAAHKATLLFMTERAPWCAEIF